MGIDILNPVQWTCPNMDMVELKQEFGKKICFHGASTTSASCRLERLKKSALKYGIVLIRWQVTRLGISWLPATISNPSHRWKISWQCMMKRIDTAGFELKVFSTTQRTNLRKKI